MTQAQATAYAKAQLEIAACRKSGDTTLDLSNLRLSALPPEIGQLTESESIIINGNPLQEIPPEAVPLLNPNNLEPAHRQLWEKGSRLCSGSSPTR